MNDAHLAYRRIFNKLYSCVQQWQKLHAESIKQLSDLVKALSDVPVLQNESPNHIFANNFPETMTLIYATFVKQRLEIPISTLKQDHFPQYEKLVQQIQSFEREGMNYYKTNVATMGQWFQRSEDHLICISEYLSYLQDISMAFFKEWSLKSSQLRALNYNQMFANQTSALVDQLLNDFVQYEFIDVDKVNYIVEKADYEVQKDRIEKHL